MLGSFGTKRTVLMILGTFTSFAAALAVTPPRISEPASPLAQPAADRATPQQDPTTPSPAPDPDCTTDALAAPSTITIPGITGDDDRDGSDEYEHSEDAYEEESDEESDDDSEDLDEYGDEDEAEHPGYLRAATTSLHTTAPVTPAPSAPTTAVTTAPTPATDCPPTGSAPAIGAASTPGSATPPVAPTPGSVTPPAASVLRSGSHLGQRIETRYGPLQVKITVVDGKITGVTVPVFPSGDGRSRSISNAAIPVLVTEAIRVQSASVNAVSGASYTTEGFRRSLAAAISAAKK